jgi:hypothetical protein
MWTKFAVVILIARNTVQSLMVVVLDLRRARFMLPWGARLLSNRGNDVMCEWHRCLSRPFCSSMSDWLYDYSICKDNKV